MLYVIEYWDLNTPSISYLICASLTGLLLMTHTSGFQNYKPGVYDSLSSKAKILIEQKMSMSLPKIG